MIVKLSQLGKHDVICIKSFWLYVSILFPEKQSEILLCTVCAAGNMDCRIIRDNYENCWTHNQPGERPSGGVGENHLLG